MPRDEPEERGDAFGVERPREPVARGRDPCFGEPPALAPDRLGDERGALAPEEPPRDGGVFLGDGVARGVARG